MNCLCRSHVSITLLATCFGFWPISAQSETKELGNQNDVAGQTKPDETKPEEDSPKVIKEKRLDPGDRPIKKKSIPDIELVRASHAEYITINKSKEGILIFQGGIVFRYRNATLIADVVKMNPSTGEIYAEGNIVLKDDLQEIKADKFIFDNNQQQGVLYKASTYLEPIYYLGDRMKQVEPKTFLASVSYFTSCNAEKPHYYFKAKRIYVFPENQIVAQHLTIHIGDFPVFYLPLLMATDFGTGIITQYGNGNRQGHFLQNTYYMGFSSSNLEFYKPTTIKIMADWYQTFGQMMGINLHKRSRNLNYDVQFAVARSKTVYDDFGTNTFSNTGLNTDGSCCAEQSEVWYKIDSSFKALFRKSNEYDSQSQLYVQFQQYSNLFFDARFNQRFEPRDTISAMGLGLPTNFDSLAGAQNIFWNAAYVEDWRNNHFAIKVKRALAWRNANNDNNSRYVPQEDLAPRIEFSKRMQLIRSDKKWFSGAWLNLSMNGQINRFYADGAVLKTLFNGNGAAQTDFYFPLHNLVALTPGMGYGLLHQFAQEASSELRTESNRQSYQFVFTDSKLRLGTILYNINFNHYFRSSFDDKLKNPTFGTQRAHYLDVNTRFDFAPYAIITTTTRRDLRSYPYSISEKFRWRPFIVNTEADYDFVHGFTYNHYGLKKKKKYHFMGIGLKNTFTYLIRYNKPEINDASIYYQLGGYRLPFIRELLIMRVGLQWHHNFIDIRQDTLGFNWSVEAEVFRYTKLYLGGSSIANQLERYQTDNANHLNIFNDLANGFNLFDSNRNQDTVFNLQSFYATIEHDLHRWFVKLRYTLSRKPFFHGNALRDKAIVFEHTVFLTLQLKDLSGFGIPDRQIYRSDPSQNIL